jgi:glycosyltransferase involved in cell wall biosynthesis
MRPLSVLICTRDESVALPECLASAAFADEIVVVDSGSTDDTVDIARRAGARVLHHDFESHAAQKNWGITQVAHEWVLILDADERVSDALREEIVGVLDEAEPRAGYWIWRSNRFLGRAIRGSGWQRDRVLRLFDRSRGRYEARLVHEEVRLDAPAGRLRNRLRHDSCRDLSTWLRKTNHYATLGAAELRSRGRKGAFRDVVLRPPARFVKQYVFQQGFRDGTEGFILCVVAAYGVFAKYALLWERRS